MSSSLSMRRRVDTAAATLGACLLLASPSTRASTTTPQIPTSATMSHSPVEAREMVTFTFHNGEGINTQHEGDQIKIADIGNVCSDGKETYRKEHGANTLLHRCYWQAEGCGVAPGLTHDVDLGADNEHYADSATG